MELTLASLCLAALLPATTATLPQTDAAAAAPAASAELKSDGSTAADSDETPYVHDFEFVPAGEFDPASVPLEDGIAWYGTWEAAMAEKERTGKPVMLHMGSPRCPAKPGYRVPGTW
jgi:hypothetical protein